jgi:myo-inositol-1(or 4)-monophosphatase
MENFLEVAKLAAKEAGKLLKEKINKAKILAVKSNPYDLQTDADLATQKLIVEIIKKHFPKHGIIAEENSEGKNVKDEYSWAIDPIDGTAAFSVGLPTYSSSIALLWRGEPIVGAVYLAILDEVIYAAKGGGAFKNEGRDRLRCSANTQFKDVAVGFDPTYCHREKYLKTLAAPLADKVRILPMLWSQVTSLSLVAYGILGGYVQSPGWKVWDVAAGKLLVEEAGGVITDFEGREIDLFKVEGYAAGNKAIHKKLLSYIHRLSL